MVLSLLIEILRGILIRFYPYHWRKLDVLELLLNYPVVLANLIDNLEILGDTSHL